MIIHVFIASFSPAQGERNQMVNTKFTRPVNEMPMSSVERNGVQLRLGRQEKGGKLQVDIGILLTGLVNSVFTI